LYFAHNAEVCNLSNMNTERDRVISISLSEAEWQAFVARHPQPVNWLREQIRAQVPGVSVVDNVQASDKKPMPTRAQE
jgi:hypothetical protein